MENFINTTQIDCDLIIGEVYSETYVITQTTITAILHLSLGRTETVNVSSNLTTYDARTNGTRSFLTHDLNNDGWSVSQGATELQAWKYSILQGIYFKRKQTYTSHCCILFLLTVDDIFSNSIAIWNRSRTILRKLQTKVQTIHKGQSLHCYLAEV